MAERKFDFIILGASGYTGQFVVEEVARVSKEIGSLKYAIAGRNKEKLGKVLQTAKENTGLSFENIEIIIVDVNDKDSLISMASKGKVIINCVGPYRFYGAKVVEACIEAGADHVDISGEPQYLEHAQLLFSDKAKENKVHIVGSCGFDSVPAEMGTIYLKNNFKGDVNSIDMVVGYSDDSEGCGVGIEASTTSNWSRNESELRNLDGVEVGMTKLNGVGVNYNVKSEKGTLWWSSEAQRWCLPNLASDRSVVMRTQHMNYQLFNERPIQFNAFFGMKSVLTAIGGIMFGLIFSIMASYSFTRNLFLKFPSVFSFGAFSREGANRENLKGLKFLLTFIGEGWDNTLNSPDEQHSESPNVKKIAQVSGPDPGYIGTAMIIVQCGVTMLQEKNKLPKGGGVFTPGAAFLKTSLIERLQKKGIQFKMVK